MPSSQVNFDDENYPSNLKNIKKPPQTLYFQGAWDENIFENCLAVVGTRKMTDYGRRAIEKIVRPVAELGITIVSGFMYGCDAAAHQACLAVQGRTIAVLGAGIELVTPAGHKKLKQQVLENKGLMLSELPGDYPAYHWTFAQRNRIISGLSKAVLIVQAPKGSGALITADYAEQQKRKLLAVPGEITSSVSYGPNKLIKEGAMLISSPEDVLTALDISSDLISKTKDEIIKDLSGSEQEIVEILSVQKLSIDKIARELNQPVGEIGRILSLLCLRNIVHQDKGGNYYAD